MSFLIRLKLNINLHRLNIGADSYGFDTNYLMFANQGEFTLEPAFAKRSIIKMLGSACRIFKSLKKETMLYIFRSKNAADVIMLDANGRTVLGVIGKDAEATGIILAAQMPAAIQALKDAVELEEFQLDKSNQDVVKDEMMSYTPGLRQRAIPFIDMLQRNHKAGTDITWGV